jgi:hypothetical protein
VAGPAPERMGGTEQLIQVVDHLVKLARAERPQ